MLLSYSCALLISSVSSSHGLIDDEFPGIDEHHHEHSARKNVVGSNLALIVRVPHKRPAALVGGVSLHVGRLKTTGGPGSAGGGVRTQIRTATIPGAVGENVGIGQSSRTAAFDIAQRSSLYWLEVVLTPLVIIDGAVDGGDSHPRALVGVVAVGIRNTGRRGVRASGIGKVMAVHIPVEALAGEIEKPIEGQPWSGGGGELERAGEVTRTGTGITGNAGNEVAVAGEDAHMVRVLVEGMLPAALSDDA